jgi:hypothetical protein
MRGSSAGEPHPTHGPLACHATGVDVTRKPRISGIAFAMVLAALSTRAAAADESESCSTALADNLLLRGWQFGLGGANDVPSQFWGAAMQTLQPMEVRVDRGNIAVVTQRSNATESGVYYVLRGSSYAPTNSNGRLFNCSRAGAQLEFTFTR